MQKREQSKGGGGSATPASKRGRPFGSGGSNAAASAAIASGDSIAPSTLLGPSLQVHSAFAEQNNKRIVLALQSGLKSELTWALNTLTVLSFKEKDDVRKDATPLAKISGLLDALLQVIDDWRDVAFPRVLVKKPRARMLGANSVVTGFGSEYEALSKNESSHSSLGSNPANKDASLQRNPTKSRPSDWWFDEDGIFNMDEEGRAEKQLCAVAASNVFRNFSFMAENEVIMAQHRHTLESLFQCIEDYVTEDEELVTNALETVVNLAHLLDLRIFSSSKPSYIKMTEQRAVQAIMGMLGSSVKAWHCAAAELLGRLIINPDNEPFILPFAPQIYKRLVDIMSLPAADAQGAAVGALYNLSEVNVDCRLKLAGERWAIDRLLKVIKGPHPVPEVCRKAAMILENLVSEPQNKPLLLVYENAFAEMLFADGKYSDTFARILFELTSRPGNRVAATRGCEAYLLMCSQDLPPNVKEAQEKKLDGFKKEQEALDLKAKERKIFLRNWKIKFFERRKIERRIRRIEKQQRAAAASTQEMELTQQLLKLKEDLEYVKFFPKTVEYVPLFVGGDDEKTEEKREKIRELTKANKIAAAASGKDLEETGSDDDALMDASEDDFFLSGSSSDADADDEWTDRSTREQASSASCKAASGMSSDERTQRQMSARALMPPPRASKQIISGSVEGKEVGGSLPKRSYSAKTSEMSTSSTTSNSNGFRKQGSDPHTGISDNVGSNSDA